MEYLYRSVPYSCTILETARTTPIYGEYLECYGFGEVSFEDLKFRAADPDFIAYVEEAKRMRVAFPGLEIRTLELGLERQALRTAIEDSLNPTLLAAVDGGDILGVSITSTSGEPIRYQPPYAVKSVVDELDSGRFVVSTKLADTFNKLANFYRFASAFDEGVVTIKL